MLIVNGEKEHRTLLHWNLELQKGGRIGKVQGIVGVLLNIKPIVRVEMMGYTTYGKTRSQEKALDG